MIIKVEIMLKSITTFQLTETFNIPVMELLKDVTSLLIGEINEELKVPLSKNTNFERILNSYLYKMYETRWFPYVGLGYSYEFANNILSAISTNKDKMIEEVDSIIFEYFNDDIIKRIKKTWENANVTRIKKRILDEAVNAYYRKEYALTVSTIVVLWEGIIATKVNEVDNKRTSSKTKKI